jgi:hypothetical protein
VPTLGGLAFLRRSASQKMPFYMAVPQECESAVRETFDRIEITWNNNIQQLV